MLKAYPTKKGTGVAIYGDFDELECLYDTVHQIACSLLKEDKYQKGQHLLLMCFAHDIRKAFSAPSADKRNEAEWWQSEEIRRSDRLDRHVGLYKRFTE